MLKYSTKCLTVLLTIVSIASLSNVLVIYWLPVNIPLSSFSVVRLAVVAFIEKKYYLILVSLLIGVLLFFAAVAIGRQRILVPGLSLLYLIYDFIMVFSLLIEGLEDGYWRTYIIQVTVSITLVVLLSAYCGKYLRYNLRKSR